jgi:Sulfatase-modifying factor enzyme 1
MKALFWVGAFVACACDGDEPRTAPASERAIGSLVSVSKQSVEEGFKLGVLRASRKVPAFRISKHPVTHEQFDECVKARACQRVEGPAEVSEDAAMINVGLANARAFCSWVGGRLPNLSEWFSAARGREVRRFAWGDDPPDCKHHPQRSSAQVLSSQTEALVPCAGDPADALRVAKHPKGAASSGVEDVLLAPAELVDASVDALLPVCGDTACQVFGLEPGAIDAVGPLPEASVPGASASHDYSFRCVLEGGE